MGGTRTRPTLTPNDSLCRMVTVISTTVLHILGVVIGEVSAMRKWLWQGLRFIGGVVIVSAAVFVLQSLSRDSLVDQRIALSL